MIKSESIKGIQYSPRTLKRAERAMRCSPFELTLFATMRSQSVPLQAIVGESGLQLHYTRSLYPELATENALLWLIQVGVLRREVDGQGITDSFRLTPLGRQLIEQWQGQESNWPHLPLSDRLSNAMSRWLRLPL